MTGKNLEQKLEHFHFDAKACDELVAKGYSEYYMSKILGIPPTTLVRYLIHDNKYSFWKKQQKNRKAKEKIRKWLEQKPERHGIDESKLRGLAEQGYTLQYIAREVGASHVGVMKALRRLRIHGSWQEKRQARIQGTLSNNLDGERVGFLRELTQRMYQKLEMESKRYLQRGLDYYLQRKQSRIPLETIFAVAEARETSYREGKVLGIVEFGRKFGLSYTTIQKIIPKLTIASKESSVLESSILEEKLIKALQEHLTVMPKILSAATGISNHAIGRILGKYGMKCSQNLGRTVPLVVLGAVYLNLPPQGDYTCEEKDAVLRVVQDEQPFSVEQIREKTGMESKRIQEILEDEKMLLHLPTMKYLPEYDKLIPEGLTLRKMSTGLGVTGD
ncbi:MAG: hypothetical protein AABY26_06620, partial [Nanoarchaeota archaeon]